MAFLQSEEEMLFRLANRDEQIVVLEKLSTIELHFSYHANQRDALLASDYTASSASPSTGHLCPKAATQQYVIVLRMPKTASTSNNTKRS